MALIEEELSHLARREQALFTEDMATLCVGQFSESLSQADTAEKLLADDMERLSVAEHERAIFDLHGISEYLHDERISSEMIDSKLSELEHELQKIHNKQDFERAKYLNESYVNDRAFRALFLICDDFDTRLAAQRMVLHFRVKRELFGDGQVLGRDIRLSDLSNDDMVALESGSVQILRTRDVAGRLVVLAVPSMKPSHVSVESIVCLYIWFVSR
jgi:RNase H-fold protein (predicted Holliday junction resolvase)